MGCGYLGRGGAAWEKLWLVVLEYYGALHGAYASNSSVGGKVSSGLSIRSDSGDQDTPPPPGAVVEGRGVEVGKGQGSSWHALQAAGRIGVVGCNAVEEDDAESPGRNLASSPWLELLYLIWINIIQGKASSGLRYRVKLTP